MTKGRFKDLDFCAFARATDLMSTQSPLCFEWSVRCTGNMFMVGIASQHERENKFIFDYDKNAILLFTNGYSTMIKMGKEIMHSNLTEHKAGDIIRFRFQPHAKKLLIDSII